MASVRGMASVSSHTGSVQRMHQTNNFCLFDLILYILVNNFSVMSGMFSLAEPVQSKDK